MLDTRESALEFFESRHNSEILSHAIITDSGNKGPHLVIVGGTHGHEPVGVNAAIAYIRHFEENSVKLKKGKISWILANPLGFKRNIRFVEQNMNRAFSEKPSSTYEGRRAQEIRKYLTRASQASQIDVLLDLHSVSVGDFKVAICTKEIPEHYPRLAALSPLQTHFTFSYPHLPGSFIEEGNQYGAFSFTIECGNNTDPEAIHTALWHINRLLTDYDLVDSDSLLEVSPIEPPEHILHFTAIEAVKPGVNFSWTNPNITTGSKIKKGEVYATFEGGKHIAPQDCVAFIPDRNPRPDDFDAGFICELDVVLPSFITPWAGRILETEVHSEHPAFLSKILDPIQRASQATIDTVRNIFR